MSQDRACALAPFWGPAAAGWFPAGCLVILLAAAALRFAGLSWDMPFIYHPDEPGNLTVVQDMLRNGTANPAYFNYPSLFFYLHAPGQLLVWAMNGELQPIVVQMMGSGRAPQPEAFLIARALTVCFGVGIVAATLWLAREIGLGAPAILFAGALAAINPLLVAYSRTIAPDVAAAFFCVLALIAAVRVASSGAMSAYVLGGIMTGLAASTKYNAGLVGLAIAAAHILRSRLDLSRLHLLVAAGAISVAIFLLTSPFVMLDFPRALDGFLSEVRHYRTGHPGYEGEALKTNVLWLWGFFGASLCLLVLTALHPARAKMLPLAVFIAAYFTLISVQVVRFDRNLMPILPALVVLIAGGFEVALSGFRRWVPRSRLRGAVCATLAAILLVPGAAQSLSGTAARYNDRRAEIRGWIAQHLAPGTSVFTDSYSPYLDPAIYKVSAAYFVLREPLANLTSHDVIVVSREGSGRFLNHGQSQASDTLRELGARACERREFRNAAAVTDYWVFRLKC